MSYPTTQRRATAALGKPLSPSELDALRLAAQGLTNAAIGSRTGRAEDTVKTQMRRVFAKLGVGDRAHAVAVAYQRGILRLPPTGECCPHCVRRVHVEEGSA